MKCSAWHKGLFILTTANVCCLSLSATQYAPQAIFDRFVTYDEFGRVNRTIDTDSLRFNELFYYDLHGNVTEIRRGSAAKVIVR